MLRERNKKIKKIRRVISCLEEEGVCSPTKEEADELQSSVQILLKMAGQLYARSGVLSPPKTHD